jgi:hypothetical protein
MKIKNNKKIILIVLVFILLLIFLCLVVNKSLMYKYELFTDVIDSEEKCKYISSYGIMKSCTIYSSSTPISSIKVLQDYDFTKGFNNCTIYICTSALPEFISKINNINNINNTNNVNDINYKFILVSGDADETTPTDIVTTNEEFIKFIENDKIVHWYAQNCIGKHPKLSPIPIGLDYHTMNNTINHPWGESMTPKKQEDLLMTLSKDAKPFWERLTKCYSNFHFAITDSKYGYDRTDAMNTIQNELIYYEPNKIKRLETWKNMSTFCFILSPHGNGLDCHRTWEALCLGCIPIVKTSSLDVLFYDLPVLIVNEWSDVTLELLNYTISNYKTKYVSNQFNYDTLLLHYWMNKIKTSAI